MLRVREVEAPHVALDVADYRPLERKPLAPQYRPVPKNPDVVPVVVHGIGLGAGRALVFQFSSFGRFGEAGGLRGGVRGGVRQGGTGGCSPLAIRASSSRPTNDALSRKAACRASSLGSGRLLFSQRLKSSIRAASSLHAAQADVKSLIDAFASAIDAFCALAAHLLSEALRAMLGLAWPAVITTTEYGTIDPESNSKSDQGRFNTPVGCTKKAVQAERKSQS